MKLSKFLLILTFITLLALVYVYQQTEIFRLAYLGQKNVAVFEDLLDKNTILRYNIKRNGSLICIGNKISRYANFEIPNTYRLVRLAAPLEGLKVVSKNRPRKENILSRFFAIKRQAEAKTINP